MQDRLLAPYPARLQDAARKQLEDLGVEVIIKKSGEAYYILAANADKNPIKVSISGFGREDNGEVLFENRSVKIKDRELTDYFEPFDVHVYKLHDD